MKSRLAFFAPLVAALALAFGALPVVPLSAPNVQAAALVSPVLASPMFYGLNKSGAAPFSPLDISGIVLWLRADALAQADNSTVTTWPDSSGHGYSAVQSTLSKRPRFRTNILNGKPVVRFDGVDDTMLSSAWIEVQPYTVVAVVQTSVLAHQYVIDSDTTNGAAILASDGLFGTGWAVYADGTGTGSITSIAVNTPYVITVKVSGTAVSFYKNGVAYSATQGANGRFDSARIGSSGDSMPATGFWTGDIADVLIYDSALSDSNREALENYEGAKYGITITH